MLNASRYPMQWVLDCHNQTGCVKVVNWIFAILTLLISGYWCLVLMFLGSAIIAMISTEVVDPSQVSAWILLIFWPQFIYVIYNIVYLARGTDKKLANDERGKNNLLFLIMTLYTFVWIIPFAIFSSRITQNQCTQYASDSQTAQCSHDILMLAIYGVFPLYVNVICYPQILAFWCYRKSVQNYRLTYEIMMGGGGANNGLVY